MEELAKETTANMYDVINELAMVINENIKNRTMIIRNYLNFDRNLYSFI